MRAAATSYVNQGVWDRTLRVLLGGALLILGWSGAVSGLWAMAIKLFALVPLGSGLLGWDPVYALIGFSTRKG